MGRNKRLEARVELTNAVNNDLNVVGQAAREFFTKHMGKKVAAMTPYPRLMVKIADAMFGVVSLAKCHINFAVRAGSITLEVEAHRTVDNELVQVRAQVTLVNVEKGVVTIIRNPETRRTNFTADEIQKARMEVRELREQMLKAMGKLFDFGEHDRY